MEKKNSYVRIAPELVGGRQGYRYTVECGQSGRPIASGWCESEAMAQKMGEKMQPTNDR